MLKACKMFGCPDFCTALSVLFLEPIYRETASICRDLGCRGLSAVSLSDTPRENILFSRLESVCSSLLVGRVNLRSRERFCLPCIKGIRDALLFCFVLSSLRRDVRMKVLREACRVGRHVFLVDYRNPERNLDIPAVLAARGLHHLGGRVRRERYRAFCRDNAVEGMAAMLGTFNAGQGGSIRSGDLLMRKPVLGGAASFIVWRAVR